MTRLVSPFVRRDSHSLDDFCGLRQDASIAFEIADRGPGLTEEVQRCLFEPFFTTKMQGMGIGLSICRTIVAEHGGQIAAFGNDAGGATFCVRLPLPTERDLEPWRGANGQE